MGPFYLATLLSAWLLFQVQPLIARVILPGFGGTPAVWTTCMLFFQSLLVVGYAYSHLLVARLSPRAQLRLHLALLLASALGLLVCGVVWRAPLIPPRAWLRAGDHAPQWLILRALGVAVGVPYLALSTTGPLLQAWFRRVARGRSPYRLYALSNAGSLLGLVSYPLLVEPWLALRAQAFGFLLLYLGFVAATALVARRAALAPVPVGDTVEGARSEINATDECGAPGWIAHLGWTTLALVASTLLLATTNQLCQDVAAIPFLWVVPLALYLTSFILCFDHPRWSRRWLWICLYGISVLGALYLLPRPHARVTLQIAVWSMLLFTGAMVCHGELQRSSPHPRHLTGFYLAIAFGGAAGGLFVGVVAPAWFHGYFEVHLAIGAGALVALGVGWRDCVGPLRGDARFIWRALMALAAVLLVVRLGQLHGRAVADVLSSSRSFFGVLRVTEKHVGDPVRGRRFLSHGRIIHGMQLTAPERRREPTTYYEPESGIGRALRLHPRPRGTLRVGMCGLGVGTIATYAQPGDVFRFYEIDPAVVALSRGSDPLFTFLSDSAGAIEVAVGDARISLEEERSRGERQAFDVLAIDAFSGDAIPIHLLTREALALYLEHLAPDGVLALHVSNRHVALLPVVRRLADALGLSLTVVDTEYDEVPDQVAWESTWALLGRTPAVLAPYGESDDEESRRAHLWTDEYSNLLQVLRY